MAISQSTATRWKIDPGHSTVEFAVKHLMVTTVKGRFRTLDGSFIWDEAHPEASSVTVTIDASSIDTGNAQRDEHLRSGDFFDVERFPTITFRSTQVEPLGQDKVRVIGDLTIRDVTREVALDVTLEGRTKSPWGSEVAGFSAETVIDRKDFGLTWNMPLEMGGVLVDDRVRLMFAIEAVREA
jgi:polyisoprenoid-binding protein YceI